MYGITRVAITKAQEGLIDISRPEFSKVEIMKENLENAEKIYKE